MCVEHWRPNADNVIASDLQKYFAGSFQTPKPFTKKLIEKEPIAKSLSANAAKDVLAATLSSRSSRASR